MLGRVVSSIDCGRKEGGCGGRKEVRTRKSDMVHAKCQYTGGMECEGMRGTRANTFLAS